MKITVTERKDDGWGDGGYLTTEIETKDGSDSAGFGHGEPEDNYLFRDLSDAYSIKNMLILAYNAGKNGEELEIEELEEE